MTLEASAIEAAGSAANRIRWTLTAQERTDLQSLDTGSRFLQFITEPAALPAQDLPLAGDVALGAIGISGALTRSEPASRALAGDVALGALGISGALTKEEGGTARALAGDVALGALGITAALTRTDGPRERALAGDVALGALGITGALTKEVGATTRPLAGDVALGALGIAGALTREARPIVVGDFTVPAGRAADFVCLIEVDGSSEIYNAAGGNGTILAGDLAFADADIEFNRIVLVALGPRFVRTGADSIAAVFAAGAAYATANVHFQTGITDVFALENSDANRTRANDVRYNVTASERSALADQVDGDRIIVALTREVAAAEDRPLAGDMALGALGISGALTKEASAQIRALAGDVALGAIGITAALTVTDAGTTPTPTTPTVSDTRTRTIADIQLWEADRSAAVTVPAGGLRPYVLQFVLTDLLGDRGRRESTGAIEMAASSPAAVAEPAILTHRRVIRVEYSDSTREEWRITRSIRRISGEGNAALQLEPLWMDLASTISRQTIAGTAPRVSLEWTLVGVTPLVALQEIITRGAPAHFEAGTVAASLSAAAVSLHSIGQKPLRDAPASL